jgi:hypothetical protein
MTRVEVLKILPRACGSMHVSDHVTVIEITIDCMAEMYGVSYSKPSGVNGSTALATIASIMRISS